MLTQQDFATLLLRGKAVQQKATSDLLTQQSQGCFADWSWVVCLSHKLQGLAFSLLIGDYISVDGIGSYNSVVPLVQGQYGVPATDPNAQTGGNTITVSNPASQQKPAADEVLYSDSNWDDTHTIYSNPDWAGFTPRIYDNGNKFLQLGVDYTVLLTGGFTLAQPIYDGIIYYVIF